MKKILIVLMVLLFISCDKYVYYNFYILNNCNYSIKVIIENSRKVMTEKLINSKEEILVYESQGFNILSEEKIEFVFSSIIAIHGQDTTKVDYVDKDLWNFQIIDNEHANYFLKIDSLDFR